VRRAVEERAIDYPVAVDNDYAVWNAFDNHYWPALYFVDTDGVLRDAHFGEGRYEQSERVLQELLGVDRAPVPVEALGVEAPADWDHLRSPETYLGYARGERFASPENAAPDRAATYSMPEALRVNQWALAGDWSVEGEKVRLVGGGGSVTYRFDARDAHLVLSAGGGPPVPFQVRLDAGAPGASGGLDVDADGRGTLEEGRLYQLVRAQGPVHEHTLEITFDAPGAAAYVFTFG
jgi:hypothetical protein